MKLPMNHPIFMIEDSPEDYDVAIRALKKAGLGNTGIDQCYANGASSHTCKPAHSDGVFNTIQLLKK